MRFCKDIGRRVTGLAGLRPEELSAGDREHLAACPACARALAAARLGRGLLAAVGEGPEPSPAGFPERVLIAVPGRFRPKVAGADQWRPAWGLVPAFVATATALLILFRASPAPAPAGLVPDDSLSASERLVLEGRPLDPDLILAAVMEEGGR